MKSFLSLALSVWLAPAAFGKEPPKPMVTGLKNPESVCVGPGPDRKVFVTTIGEFDKDGDGAVVVLEPGGKAVPVRRPGSTTPRGSPCYQKWLFVADKTKVLRIDATARRKAEVFAAATKFPDAADVPQRRRRRSRERHRLRQRLRQGRQGRRGLPHRSQEGTVALVVDAKKLPGLHTPNGLHERRHVVPARRRLRHRHPLPRQARRRHVGEVAEGIGRRRRPDLGPLRPAVHLQLEDRQGVRHRRGRARSRCSSAEGFKSAADICLDPTGKIILVPT